MDDRVVTMWLRKDYQEDTVEWLWWFSGFSVVSLTFWSSHFLLLLLFSWPYIQHFLLFKNIKQIIDYDCHFDPIWSCRKAGVILITYVSRHTKRHGSPKAAGMRCEPLWLMANAPLWSADILGGCSPYETLLHEDHAGFMLVWFRGLSHRFH